MQLVEHCWGSEGKMTAGAGQGRMSQDEAQGRGLTEESAPALCQPLRRKPGSDVSLAPLRPTGT